MWPLVILWVVESRRGELVYDGDAVNEITLYDFGAVYLT